MTFYTAFIGYVLLWWLLLFIILPWNITSVHESVSPQDDNQQKLQKQGIDMGAPLKTSLRWKLFLTSILALLVWLTLWGLFAFEIISLDSFPGYRPV